MNIKTALELSDSLSQKAKNGKKISKWQWALRVLAGAYRRQKLIEEKSNESRNHLQ